MISFCLTACIRPWMHEGAYTIHTSIYTYRSRREWPRRPRRVIPEFLAQTVFPRVTPARQLGSPFHSPSHLFRIHVSSSIGHFCSTPLCNLCILPTLYRTRATGSNAKISSIAPSHRRPRVHKRSKDRTRLAHRESTSRLDSPGLSIGTEGARMSRCPSTITVFGQS